MRAQPAADRETVQRNRPDPIPGLTERDPRFEPVAAGHDIDPHGSTLHRGLDRPEIGGCMAWKELIEARRQAAEVRVELNRAAIDDEQSLEDAVAGIGHGGHCGNLAPFVADGEAIV